MDELTNALDFDNKNKIINFVKQINKKCNSVIIFFTTHDISEILELNGRTFFVDKNKREIYEKKVNSRDELIRHYLGEVQ